MYILIIILILVLLIKNKNIINMKIKDYPKNRQLKYNDKVIGTKSDTGKTYNYELHQINNYIYPRISETFNYNSYLDDDGVLNFSKVLDSGTYVIDVFFREKDGGAVNAYAGQGVILRVEKYENINDSSNYYVYQYWRILSNNTTKRERLVLVDSISNSNFNNV